AERMKLLDGSYPAELRDEVGAKVRELLETQRDFLQALIKTYATYRGTLVPLSVAETRLVAKIQQITDYIDENVLWIRSALPVYQSRLPSLEWKASARAWSGLLSALISDFGANPA